jgi:hypothetical protein
LRASSSELASRACRPEDPASTSRPEFDRGRGEVPEFACAPTARQISRRIGLAWSVLLDAIFGSPDTVRKTIRARIVGRQNGATYLTDQHVGSALRAAAHLLEQETLKPHEYLLARRELLRRDRTRWMHGGNLMLPAEGQIERVAGDWDRALKAAGLQPRSTTHGRVNKPYTEAEVLELCLNELSTLPTAEEMRLYAIARGLPMARRKQPYGQTVKDVTAARAARGLTTPATRLPVSQRPDYSAPTNRSPRGPGRAPKRLDEQQLLAGLVVFLDELCPDEWATQEMLLALSTTDSRIPAPSSVTRHGGCDEVLGRARAVRRERRFDRSA